jgi:hypothetical protein
MMSKASEKIVNYFRRNMLLPSNRNLDVQVVQDNCDLFQSEPAAIHSSRPSKISQASSFKAFTGKSLEIIF